MPDPTPIPSASALARAVEASERNRREEFDRGWNAAIDSAARFFERIVDAAKKTGHGQRAEEMTRFAFSIRALRRDTPDAG